MKQWVLTEPYLSIKGNLLEGPSYDQSTSEVSFIDINDQLLYTFDPRKGPGSLKKVKTNDTLGVTAKIQGSEKELIVGAKYGFATLDRETGEVSYIVKVEKNDDAKADRRVFSRMRFNDGAVDSRGRLWAGSMNDSRKKDPPEAEGTLYRLDGDLTCHIMLENVFTPNGMAWNKADTKMFWTDSEVQDIYVFDFDAETGGISNQKVFYHFNFGPGINPDGLVIDDEECIWTAVWKGGKVIRLSPEGEIIADITLPTAFVTCPVFIGTELLITTCNDSRVTDDSVARGGDVYKVDVGVTGPLKHKFRYA